MATPYVEWAAQQKMYPIKKFYFARFFRILPLLFFTSIVFLAFRNFSHLNKGISNVYTAFDYFKCLLLIDGRMIRLNPVLWTLRVELIFYILFPLIGWLIFYSFKSRRKFILYFVLFAYIALSIIFNISGWFDKYSFESVSYMLFLGTLNRILFQEDFIKDIPTYQFSNYIQYSLLILIVLLIHGYVKYLHFNSVTWIVIVILTNSFFLLTIVNKGYINKILSIKFFSKIAMISYGLYLWHFNLYYMVIVPWKEFLYPDNVILNNFIGHLTILILTFLLATGTYFLIEKPIAALRHINIKY